MINVCVVILLFFLFFMGEHNHELLKNSDNYNRYMLTVFDNSGHARCTSTCCPW